MANSDQPLLRELIVERLHQDLIGPREPEEVLTARPSDVWLTGILWPQDTRLAPEEDDRLAVAGDGDSAGDDADDDARPAISSMVRPSTAGLSFAVSGDSSAPEIDADISFGVYVPEDGADGKRQWRRQLVSVPTQRLTLSRGHQDILLAVPEVPGLRINTQVAVYKDGYLVTVTLVNGAMPEETGREAAERLTLFQVELELRPAADTIFLARPSRRRAVDDDDRSVELLYRDAKEYAAGHTCSADWTIAADAPARADSLRIAWLPSAETPATSSEGHLVFRDLSGGGADPLSATWLSTALSGELDAGLKKLCAAYETWIGLQVGQSEKLDASLKKTAERHLAEARKVLSRMRAGIACIVRDPVVASSFRMANLAMDTQSRWKDGTPLRWRPFQLGFLLLSMESALDGTHADRKTMDLLWFPTGGGKTEAYLGLIALVAFHRRLSRKDPDEGAGVSTIMRYTLRLLTTQQFTRAAAMILACEAIRRGKIASPDGSRLGKIPFSIGLWVGESATPNTRKAAYESLSQDDLSSPKQLIDCPGCHQPLVYGQASGNDQVSVRCQTPACLLKDAQLPVWTVDEDIYLERPTLLVGTVDKFAQIVRKKDTAQLFAVGSGAQPQLILQDELHLISGPLGTMAGLYESALDVILSADGTRPKIIGSTATIRRAADQVRALFDREACQFPPPGIDASDSGFAVVDKSRPGRLYVGVTTAGRSAKFALQAVAACLLQAATAIPKPDNDPYWTLVTYFNSLRELGGALVLFQDDVNDTLGQIARSRGETARMPEMIEELTSRRSQREIRDLLKQLDASVTADESLDAVLATSMLSVGVDIPRLGVMLVNGQPKTMAEYIQSTSRVGRGRVPGLVVPVLNAAKPRDRSHFETFRTWHDTLYRDVEATSVTPYASRARDRALHAVLVAIVRHAVPGMLDKPKLNPASRARAMELIDIIAARAASIDPLETDVRKELIGRLESWERLDPDSYWQPRKGSLLQGAEEAAAMKAAGRTPGQAWPTPNSMRGVEPVTPYKMVEFLKGAQHAK